VILVDANILIYAHVSSFAQHSLARDWLDQQLNGRAPVGLLWASMLAFLRLVTNPRVFEHPEPTGHAWQQVHAWLACETAWIPQPTERHADLLVTFSRCRAYMAISYKTPTWPRWPWNTGLRRAPRTVISRGFAGCVGLTPSRPEYGRVSLSPVHPNRRAKQFHRTRTT
jgi:toxin-antitoxin system PIN domain toxin